MNDFRGKVIRQIRYMHEHEMRDFGWLQLGIVIEFEDGTWAVVSRDEEGNGPGALFCTDTTIAPRHPRYGSFYGEEDK